MSWYDPSKAIESIKNVNCYSPSFPGGTVTITQELLDNLKQDHGMKAKILIYYNTRNIAERVETEICNIDIHYFSPMIPHSLRVFIPENEHQKSAYIFCPLECFSVRVEAPLERKNVEDEELRRILHRQPLGGDLGAADQLRRMDGEKSASVSEQ